VAGSIISFDRPALGPFGLGIVGVDCGVHLEVVAPGRGKLCEEQHRERREMKFHAGFEICETSAKTPFISDVFLRQFPYREWLLVGVAVA
jgi:hypothetical protein